MRTDLSAPLLGDLAWVDILLIGWFTLVLISVVYVALDAWRNTPEATLIKWAWVLVTLYMGPIGLALYVFSDKEPRPGTHEEFIRPLWRQGVGSALHCVAGDATGIIAASTVTALLGLPMWIDLISEYAFGFMFGLLVFQSLFMRSMFGGSYGKALRGSLLPEWLSMNMMMAGMVPVMVAGMMGRDMRAMSPEEPLFWGVMSWGVIVGFFITYPVNVWMVAVKLKHGLKTERKGQPAPERSGAAAHPMAGMAQGEA